MTKETKTMTEKVKVKRRRGRPVGRRNRVSCKETLNKAVNSGKDLTEIKEIIEYHIEHADELGLTPKQVLDFLKSDIDLVKWMYDTLEKIEKNEEKLNKGEAELEEMPEAKVGNSVVQFKLAAED